MKEMIQANHLSKTFKLSAKQQKIEGTKEKTKNAVNDLSFTAKWSWKNNNAPHVINVNPSRFWRCYCGWEQYYKECRRCTAKDCFLNNRIKVGRFFYAELFIRFLFGAAPGTKGDCG